MWYNKSAYFLNGNRTHRTGEECGFENKCEKRNPISIRSICEG